MSRSKKDWNDTESMLARLTTLLIAHESGPPIVVGYDPNCARRDAELLRRISMTLHRWHEGECGNSNKYARSVITRGRKVNGTFEYDDSGKPYVEYHSHRGDVRYLPMADKERGAQKRLAAIMARYPTLTAYIQTDPRGCALYILKPGDVPEGADVSAYSRGLAVFK